MSEIPAVTIAHSDAASEAQDDLRQIMDQVDRAISKVPSQTTATDTTPLPTSSNGLYSGSSSSSSIFIRSNVVSSSSSLKSNTEEGGGTSEKNSIDTPEINGRSGSDAFIPQAEASVASPTVEIKRTDAEVIQFLHDQEIKKQREKLARLQLKGQEIEKEHKFWNTQPVLGIKDSVSEDVNGPINSSVTVADIKPEPYNMPSGFAWCSLDVTNPDQILEMYNLLNENYVEDDDCMFRFDYSIPFLQWALSPPGFIRDWHVGVRNMKTNALMGCITAVPVHVRVHDKTERMAEINFLCVHKKLRTKRLAPVLIKEITRRVNLLDIWQAVYTAGVVLPKPVAKCRYHHRNLNPKKLVEVKFTSLPPKMTMSNLIKSLKLPSTPSQRGLRVMGPEDVVGVHLLLKEYLETKAKLCQVFSVEEVAHIFLPRGSVVNSYVIADNEGVVTDFCSFYHLPSTVIGNKTHSKLHAVYSYYNVAKSVSFAELMKDLLIAARNEGADVVNALDVMENESVFKDLQFGQGDGFLQYYVYNWKCAAMEPSAVGLVLL